MAPASPTPAMAAAPARPPPLAGGVVAPPVALPVALLRVASVGPPAELLEYRAALARAPAVGDGAGDVAA
ncbi:MAG TPA: hypothetical protein VGS57_05760, partial [Thermoanaerobaculia bacterium]|nr:hypothetical protein [Thermoanaerobaculia bacterium]